MAERLNRRHQDMVRAKIRSSWIISRLQKHLDGKIELSKTQVQSASILLSKSLGNAPQITELTGLDGGPLEVIQKVERVLRRANAADSDR